MRAKSVSNPEKQNDRTGLRRLIAEPLVHFMLAGAALFFVSSFFDAAGPADRVVVPSSQVEQLIARFARSRGRDPNPQELAAVVEDHVREEILYREALAIGLDRDDATVRRIMRQRMEFLHEDLAELSTPTDDELRDFLNANAASYVEPARTGFRQVFLGTRTAVDAAERVQAVISALASGEDPVSLGDATILPRKVSSATQTQIADRFGTEFASALSEVDSGRWFGPIESAYGTHVVYIDRRTPPSAPGFASIRDRLRMDFAEARRHETRERHYRRLNERYDVVIDWPDDVPLVQQTASNR